jgi:hypothetical protein
MGASQLTMSIFLFIVVFGFLQLSQPKWLYNYDGSLREFGVGWKNKTILPVWVLAILLGIFSYLTVLFFYPIQRYRRG